jgi:amino acid adenylation domain-containing protein
MSMTLHGMIDEAASRRPEAEAIRCGGKALTYGELARRSNGLARMLLDTGLRRRGRVAVMLNKGLDVSVGFYGSMAAGGALVPIDPKSPLEQVVRILRATGATHLVTEPGKREVVRAALTECPEVAHLIGLDDESDFAVPVHPWTEVDEAAHDRPPDVSVIELDPCYILHTSGSTGEPKLILHTHRSAMSFVDWAVSEYGLKASDRLSNHSSHHTCFATFDYYAAARAGAATVILTPAMMMLPGSLSKHIEEERISVWYSVPTALVQLSLRGDLESRDLEALRWILFAGETFPQKHLQRIMRQLPGARFSHVYGSTEINVVTFYHLPGSDQVPSPLPIGRACSNASTEVVDADLNAVPDGDEGELIVRGGTVMSGYWGDPERNTAVLIRRPMAGGLEEVFFRTGDRVQVLDDGNLTFVTRADLQVKVRGHRVELEEVEAALLSFEPVEEAAAFTVPDGEGSLSIRSAVVVDGDANVNERDIVAAVRKILPGHAVPEGVAVLDSMPRTPTGKVDRKTLKGRLHGAEETHHD